MKAVAGVGLSHLDIVNSFDFDSDCGRFCLHLLTASCGACPASRHASPVSRLHAVSVVNNFELLLAAALTCQLISGPRSSNM